MELAVAYDDSLTTEIARIRELKNEFDTRFAAGETTKLPGNTAFLSDGRVLCGERELGDSRFPYGHDGFNFWVYGSGHMHANKGPFFIFLPTHDGREPQIGFFLGLKLADGTYRPYSLLPVPYLVESEPLVEERYTVIGHDATYFVMQTKEFTSTVRVFLDQPDASNPVIYFSIDLRSRVQRSLDAFTSTYVNPFCRHQFFETSEDRWFKKVHVEQLPQSDAKKISTAGGSLSLPPFVVTTNEDVSRFESVSHRMVIRRAMTPGRPVAKNDLVQQVCTSRRRYTGGQRRDLAQAAFLRAGKFDRHTPVTVFNDNAVAGDLNRFTLAPESTVRIDYALSLADTQDELHAQLEECIDARCVDKAYHRVLRTLEEAGHQVEAEVQGSTLSGVTDEAINHFFPYLRTQVEVCAETRGFMQPSPLALVGIRDVFQAIEGHLFDRPMAARARILEALGYVLVDGRCPRQYMVLDEQDSGLADLREFIDQGVWVISTLHTYCAATGDRAILDEEIGYCRVDTTAHNRLQRTERSDSVLHHLIRIMDYLDRHRDESTGLLRALYGDWNDALDGLGTTTDPDKQFGSGVSVMASLQLYRNCAEMIELLTKFYPGKFADQIRQYESMRSELRKALLCHAVITSGKQRRIVHGWGDKAAYYVGSFKDSDGDSRDGLTSNAFWVISGMLREDPTLRTEILDAMQRLDSPYGMKTFEPGFQPGAPGVGRIPNLPIGTAENGATYVHATTFGIMALFLMNEPRLAWKQIHKILPFAPHQRGLSHSPFVLPNSYVNNPELNLTGQNMNDWQTGCSNVLLKIFIRQAFGFNPELDQLTVAPATWFPFRAFDFSAVAHGRKIQISFARGDVTERQFVVNGKSVDVQRDDSSAIPCIRVPYSELLTGRTNIIEITDPPD